MGNRSELHLEHVLGDTWCIVTSSCRIPLYLADRQHGVMIDSGLKSDRSGILSLLEKENIRIETLLTSHYHRDHVENHPALKAAFDCHIYMTPFTDSICRDEATLRAGSYESLFMTTARGGPFVCSCDTLIGHQDTEINTSVGSFQILRLPGHAQEHIGFVTPDSVAYLGDTLLSDNLLRMIRIPYCTYVTSDLASKKAIADMHYKAYIMAHNGVCTEIRQLAEENYTNLLQKAEQLAQLCDSYMTMEQLAAKFMVQNGVDTSAPLKVFGAQRNIQVVTEYLMETGRFQMRTRDGFVEYIKT